MVKGLTVYEQTKIHKYKNTREIKMLRNTWRLIMIMDIYNAD